MEGELHYCGRDIIAYGKFKCSRCGGDVYLSSGEMGERDSDGDVFKAGKGRAYVLCASCIRAVVMQSVEGKPATGLTPYHVMSEEDFKKTIQDPTEALASTLGLTADDIDRLDRISPGWQNVASLLPLVKVFALAMLLARGYKDAGRKPDVPTIKKMVEQILKPTDTDVSTPDLFKSDSLTRKGE